MLTKGKKMATILIDPVKTKTRGGYDAEITGIDQNDEDCLKGNVTIPHGHPERCWNESGICRDSSEDLNISPKAPEVIDVIEMIKSIKN
jgi:hypothetical protein